MQRHTNVLLGAFTCGLAAGPAGAVVINVPVDHPTIQIAINFADPGDEILVAPGVYFESLNLMGKDLTLRSSDGAASTTLDALGQFDSAIHVVTSEEVVIEGFTIANGNADGIDDGDPAADDRGGALYVNGGSVTVIDCVFADNVASGFGGVFYSNGGGIASFTGCQFIDNSAGTGGVAYVNHGLLAFTDCEFSGNVALTGFGGVVRAQTTIVIEDCAFEANTAAGDGGAIWSSSAAVPLTQALTVSRSSFVGNHAAGDGGAIAMSNNNIVSIRDTILNGNTSDSVGSAMYLYSGAGSSLTVVNTTVVHNVGGTAIGGPGAKTVRSSIIWDNTGGTIGGGISDVQRSLVQGGFPGAGNIDADPMFVDPAGQDATLGTADDDLRLQAASPAIDAGDSSAVIGQYPVDFDANPRAVDDPDTPDSGLSVLGLATDMGAHEFQPGPVPPSCAADIDGDNTVGINDFLGVLAAWGPCP